MTKSRAQLSFFLGVLILVLGIAFYIFSQRAQADAQIFPATIHSDCAPWDGSAFTVQISWQDETVIDISIWQSPEINFPKTFSFPDITEQVGNAILTHPDGLSESLSGIIRFKQVDRANPVEGRFELKTASEKPINGQFKADWEEFMALCG